MDGAESTFFKRGGFFVPLAGGGWVGVFFADEAGVELLQGVGKTHRGLFPVVDTKKNRLQSIRIAACFNGQGGIRTLGTLLTYTRFPIVLFRPLRHLPMLGMNPW